MTGAAGGSDSVRLSRRVFLRVVSERANISQKQLQGVLALMQEIAVEQLETGGSFEIPGLCRFRLQRRRPRKYELEGRVRNLPFRQVLKAEPVKHLRDIFYSLDNSVDIA